MTERLKENIMTDPAVTDPAVTKLLALCRGTEPKRSMTDPDRIAELKAEVLRLTKERDQARRYGEQLYAERIAIQNDSRVLSCVFCGHQYEPGTPPSNHEALTAHVAVCPKHPAAAFRQRAEKAEADVLRLTRAQEALQPDVLGRSVQNWFCTLPMTRSERKKALDWGDCEHLIKVLGEAASSTLGKS